MNQPLSTTPIPTLDTELTLLLATSPYRERRRIIYLVCCILAIGLLVGGIMSEPALSAPGHIQGARLNLALFFMTAYTFMAIALVSRKIALIQLELLGFGLTVIQYLAFNIVSFLLTARSLDAIIFGFILEDIWFLNIICTLSFLIFPPRRSLGWTISLYTATAMLLSTRMWTAEQQGIVSPFTPFLFRALVVSLAFLLLLHTLARYRDQLIKVSARRETLEQIAFIDPLTNLPNRRQIYDTLTRVSVQIQIDMQPCSLVIWDIDHFKQINDTLGHPVGDSVLHQVAVLGRTQIRQDDLLGRWGGEEFMLVLPNTALDVAQTCAERLCRALAEHHILPEQRVTASFGVTEMQPAETIEACIQRADEALYLAKQRGRNCVCVLPAGIRQNEFLPVL